MTHERSNGVRTRKHVWGAIAASCYVLCIVAANWLLSTFGIVTVFGLAIPAGVFAAGISLSARDWLQETWGRWATVVCILIGAGLSAFLSPALALASGAAFLLSETADLLVYSRLRAKHRAWAVTLSNTVGAVVDSAVFLWLAFGSLAFFWGQVIGKEIMIAPALAVLWFVHTRRARRDAAVVQAVVA
jgi:uncharacterized PurR-regulated membrane protein YhhQ (DUF165 family)